MTTIDLPIYITSNGKKIPIEGNGNFQINSIPVSNTISSASSFATLNASKYVNITAKIKTRRGVYGVDPQQLDTRFDDEFSLNIPTVLYLLKKLIKDHDGLKKEGIFRISGDQKFMLKFKNTLDSVLPNKSIDFGNIHSLLADLELRSNDMDVFSVATLLKVWFRELPTPILQGYVFFLFF